MPPAYPLATTYCQSGANSQLLHLQVLNYRDLIIKIVGHFTVRLRMIMISAFGSKSTTNPTQSIIVDRNGVISVLSCPAYR